MSRRCHQDCFLVLLPLLSTKHTLYIDLSAHTFFLSTFGPYRFSSLGEPTPESKNPPQLSDSYLVSGGARTSEECIYSHAYVYVCIPRWCRRVETLADPRTGWCCGDTRTCLSLHPVRSTTSPSGSSSFLSPMDLQYVHLSVQVSWCSSRRSRHRRRPS